MKINFASMSARCLGAALLVSPFALAGCGGGGGPSVAPTATPTPTPIATNVSYDKNKFKPNYVTALEQERANDPDKNNTVPILRWTRFPLNIHFVRDANYTAEKQSLTTEGFDRWVRATGSKGVTYTLAQSATNADITVNFGRFTGGAGDILGQTFFSYDESTRVFRKGVNIVINITGDRDNDLITSSHEFGHALGVNGHSTTPQDLMFFTGNDQFGGGITSSDANTILTSYNGLFNKDVNARVAPSNGKIVSTSIR